MPLPEHVLLHRRCHRHRFLELPQAGASAGGEGGDMDCLLWVYDYIVEFFQYKDILPDGSQHVR